LVYNSSCSWISICELFKYFAERYGLWMLDYIREYNNPLII